MKTLSLVFLILLGCYLVACESESTDPTPDGTFTVRDFFPTGITWTYNIKEFDEKGVQTLDYSRKNEVYKIPNYRDFDTYSYDDVSKQNDTNAFYYSGDTSMYFVYRQFGLTKYAYLYPMTIGDLRYSPMGTSDTEVFTLRSTSVSVTVPAGTYDCLEYVDVRYSGHTSSPIDSQSVSYTYISPKNGPVKSTTYRFSSGTRYKAVERELTALVRK